MCDDDGGDDDENMVKVVPFQTSKTTFKLVQKRIKTSRQGSTPV